MRETPELRALTRLVETRDDEDAQRAGSVDSGRILVRMPRAVAVPRSAGDVVEIVRWANRTGSRLALRGKGHTQAGQSLTDGGVQLDTRALSRIGPLDERRATLAAQAGATWREVVACTRPRGWMPMVLTNNLDTTVGGTLATGGVGQSSHVYGTQANNVDQLEVVTGNGRRLRCSPTENRSLFDATRAGLGQFSVITEARIRIRRALPRVRTFRLLYDDLEGLLSDQAEILAQRRFHYLRAWRRRRDQRFVDDEDDWSAAGEWCCPMDVSVEFSTEPDAAGLLAGLRHRRLVRAVDRDVAEFADLPEPTPAPAARRPALAVPVTEAYVPWSAAAACVDRLFKAFPPALVPNTNIMLRPLPPEPTPMLLFSGSEPLLGVGLIPYIPAGIVQSVLPAVEAAGRRLEAAGGKRYLTGWVRRRHDEWRDHYGPRWNTVVRWKGAFDPNGVLDNGFIRYTPEND